VFNVCIHKESKTGKKIRDNPYLLATFQLGHALTEYLVALVLLQDAILNAKNSIKKINNTDWKKYLTISNISLFFIIN
jgi:hypothetical protein